MGGGGRQKKGPHFPCMLCYQQKTRNLAVLNRATSNRFPCTEGGVINHLHKSCLRMAFKGQWEAIKGIVNCSKGKCNIYAVISHVMYKSRE